jgi:hypothetical protein
MAENGLQAFFDRGLGVQGEMEVWPHPFHLLKIFLLIMVEFPPSVGKSVFIGSPAGQPPPDFLLRAAAFDKKKFRLDSTGQFPNF